MILSSFPRQPVVMLFAIRENFIIDLNIRKRNFKFIFGKEEEEKTVSV